MGSGENYDGAGQSRCHGTDQQIDFRDEYARCCHCGQSWVVRYRMHLPSMATQPTGVVGARAGCVDVTCGQPDDGVNTDLVLEIIYRQERGAVSIRVH